MTHVTRCVQPDEVDMYEHDLYESYRATKKWNQVMVGVGAFFQKKKVRGSWRAAVLVHGAYTCM